MPQKRNPKLTQDIVAGAAELRALVPLALEAMQTEHEADRTTYIMIDRALTQSCILTGDVLERLLIVLRGLRLVPDRMRQNLELTGGLIMSEAIMLELGKTIGRQKAHDAVYDAAQASFVERRPFTETLREQPEVRSNLTQDQIKALLDPERYLGACSLLAERGAKNARIVARSLGVS